MHNSFKNNNNAKLIIPSSGRKFWGSLEELGTPWKPATQFRAADEVPSSSICLIIRGEGADVPPVTWLGSLLVANKEGGCGGSLFRIDIAPVSSWTPDSTSAFYVISRHINDKNLVLFIYWLILNTHMHNYWHGNVQGRVFFFSLLCHIFFFFSFI